MKKQKIHFTPTEIEYERRRIRAVQKVLDGSTQRDVSIEFEVTEGAVSQWMTNYEEYGWEGIYSKPKTGRIPVFLDEHTIRLFNIICKTPRHFGYTTDLWKISIARDILYKQTGEHFSETRILEELHRLRFSYQKPILQAIEKNKEKINVWLNEIFRNIIIEAEKTGAEIYFTDESGISLNVFNGKTWGFKGETPVVYRSGQRTKKTIASAVSKEGNLFFELYDGGTNAERYKTFLKHLIKTDDKIKYVIHDKLPSHRSLIVKEFAESTNGKLKLFELPGYSPELNPDELVWAYSKKKLSEKQHLSLDELEKNAKSILRKMKRDKELIAGFYSHVYGENFSYLKFCQ